MIATVAGKTTGPTDQQQPSAPTVAAYVTNLISNDVSVIATASNTVVATVPVGSGPWGVAITPFQ